MEELRKLLANDSTSGRLRALAELRNLKRRNNQSVSEFCVVLEKLGHQGNPASSISDRSLEYAQIQLDNLSDWPEHVHLLSALRNVDPRNAYDSVKQLALTIEQSKTVWGQSDTKRRDGGDTWKRRSMAYQEEGRRREYGKSEPWYGDKKDSPSIEVNRYNSRSGLELTRLAETEGERSNVKEHRGPSNASSEQRKCYNCQKLAHIGRNCPLKKPQVNQIAEKARKGEKRFDRNVGKSEVSTDGNMLL